MDETAAGRYFTTHDGLRLFVRDIAASPPARGAPVLCLPGLTRNSRDFESVAPRIAAGGRRCLALDLRGRGLSDRDPNPARYVPPTYVQDVLTLLDTLQLERVAILGTSLGGLIAMALAAVAPQRLERIVLNDIGPVIEPAGLARIKTYVGVIEPAATWAEAAAKAQAYMGAIYPKEGPAFFERVARRAWREMSPGHIEADYDAALAHPFSAAGGEAPQPDMWPLFEAMKPIPLMLAHGGASDLISDATIAEMMRRRPDMRVAAAPYVGHAPYLDEPEIWPALSDFLELRPL